MKFFFPHSKFLHETTDYQPELSLKKWSQTDEEFSRTIVIKVYLLPHCNDADSSNRVKTHQKIFFWIFTTICHIIEWILLNFRNALFF